MSGPEGDKQITKVADQFVDDWNEAMAHGLHAAAYTSIQQSYDSIRQLAAHTVGIGLPQAHLVSRPEAASSGTLKWTAESLGGGAGMLPEVILLHMATRRAPNTVPR